MKQINKRKAEKFAAKYNSARLPKKKVKVVKLMSCKTCRKAQGVCKYIGKPGHLDQKGKNDYGKQTYSFVAKLMLCPLYADKLTSTPCYKPGVLRVSVQLFFFHFHQILMRHMMNNQK